MQSNEAQLVSLRARREVVKADIRAMIARLDDDQRSAMADVVHDTKDQAIAQLLVESDDAELRRAAAELQDLDAALLRVATGKYGRCCACGQEIPATRLAAYPTAKRCLPCQQKHERKR